MLEEQPTREASRPLVPLVAAIVVFVLHLIGNPHYGFFRDELYFIIWGRRKTNHGTNEMGGTSDGKVSP